ncbi:F-box protein [Acorus gramineus]|uniref:F-box protein n=1 Tax=Acorus gramineus TaxID=55184 RepID=A0AAV9ABZ5_ACOGR|nr:F-box protein [Acorus gramineus]
MDSYPNLHEDILIEILSKLPIKNLFQLRCVSKQWHDPIFQASRRLTTLPTSGLFYPVGGHYRYARLLDETDDYDALTDVDLGFFGEPMRIIDSRNGLLLCIPTVGSEFAYRVCNPMTKKWLTLPKPSKLMQAQPINSPVTVELAFDPHASRHFRVIHHAPPDLEIFSSETGRWVTVRAHVPAARARGVLADGALHVLVAREHILLRFDVETGERWVIELPDAAGACLDVCLGESGGAGVVHYASHDGSRLTVWALKGWRTSEWVERLAVEVGAFGGLECALSLDFLNPVWVFPRKFTPVGFDAGKEVVFVGALDVVFSLDFVSGRLRPLRRVEVMEGSGRVFPFSPCLFDGFDDVPVGICGVS